MFVGRVLLHITRLRYGSERLQESCGLGNRRDVMSHLHDTLLAGCS
jgi:hypothetical protein